MKVVSEISKEEEIRVLNERIFSLEDMLTRTTDYMASIQDKLDVINKDLKQKNLEIYDSLRYAQLLQSALFPGSPELENFFEESFILLQQKNLIGGDLAYLKSATHSVYIAAVDCTGHGIPGAMLSMVAYSYLNDLILNRRMETPADILQELHRMVISSIQRNSTYLKDGFDIALCRIDHSKKILEYSGARRPLIQIQNSKLIKHSPVRRSIGEDCPENFFNTTIPIQKGDSFYMFSDGIPDQFGGANQKRYGTRQLIDLLLDVSNLTMRKQKEIISSTLEAWRGIEEETDDQLLIGFKI